MGDASSHSGCRLARQRTRPEAVGTVPRRVLRGAPGRGRRTSGGGKSRLPPDVGDAMGSVPSSPWQTPQRSSPEDHGAWAWPWPEAWSATAGRWSSTPARPTSWDGPPRSWRAWARVVRQGGMALADLLDDLPDSGSGTPSLCDGLAVSRGRRSPDHAGAPLLGAVPGGSTGEDAEETIGVDTVRLSAPLGSMLKKSARLLRSMASPQVRDLWRPVPRCTSAHS